MTVRKPMHLAAALLGAALAACGGGESDPGLAYTLRPGTYTITKSSVGSADGCMLIGDWPAGADMTVYVDGAVAKFYLDPIQTSDNVWPQVTVAGNTLTPVPFSTQPWGFKVAAGLYCSAYIWRELSGVLTANDTTDLTLEQTFTTSTVDPDCVGLEPYDPTCTSEILFTITRTGP